MNNKLTLPVISSYLLALLTGLVVLKAGLLLALFSGLLVYSLVHLISPSIEKKIKFVKARLIVLGLIATIVISGLTALIFGAISFAKSDAGSLHMLFQNLAGIIESSRTQVPTWFSDYLPTGSDALRNVI